METPVQKVYTCGSPEQIDTVAAALLPLIGRPRVVAFYGPLGAGKTLLIKALCRQLGIMDQTASPSFAIMHEYAMPGGQPVYHFDFFRIKSEAEAYDLGFENYFYSDCYCFVEWAEKVGSLLPAGHAAVHIAVENRHRTITFSQ